MVPIYLNPYLALGMAHDRPDLLGSLEHATREQILQVGIGIGLERSQQIMLERVQKPIANGQ